MKKTVLLSIASMIAVFGFAQTAVNFNCNDCNSVNHDLFTELNAGKVIVITWVMPCSICIAGASTSANTVQSYASSNPGVVKFYLVDDLANTSCPSLAGWASTNSIPCDALFSNSAIDMNDYGGVGMPKTIVIGGPNHTVFYNYTGTPSVSALQSAINSAIAATGINELKNDLSTLKLFPNPAANSTSISYSLVSSADVKIEILNSIGQNVQSVFEGKQNAGDYKYNVDCSKLPNGIYFVKLAGGKEAKTISFSIAH